MKNNPLQRRVASNISILYYLMLRMDDGLTREEAIGEAARTWSTLNRPYFENLLNVAEHHLSAAPCSLKEDAL